MPISTTIIYIENGHVSTGMIFWVDRDYISMISEKLGRMQKINIGNYEWGWKTKDGHKIMVEDF